ncbi:TonB-dependent receptor plug domain-containing protein [Spongiimicrobium sp. 3-5]|uniref:TonB-dependent receptor plug domain-containing protein n=1 Tax=Spongiimicrobium sp. 3-5 TaxID=3332596 RepID=UPI003980F3A3
MNLNNVLAAIFIGLALTLTRGQENLEAQDASTILDLEEVIVTATRTERQLSSLPLPVTLISKKQLQKTGVIRLDEILNEQTGIITVADESGFEGIQMQGIASDYILILIDGVPLVGRSSGNFDLSRLTVGNIKQIEVVKGPSSSLYGSEALGGVVNIITETPKDSSLAGEVSYRLASFNTHDANINIKQKKNQFGYSLFANTLASDGYDLRPDVEGQTVNPFNNYTLNGQVVYDFDESLKLFSSARYYYQNQDAVLAVDEEVFEGSSDINEFNAHLRADHYASKKLNFQYEFYYTKYKASELLESPISEDVFSQSEFDQDLLRPEIRASYTIKPNHVITTGLGYNHENLDRTFFDEQITFNSQYVYAQYDFYPFEKLNVILGARFDNHSEYQSQFSPKFSANYSLSSAISVKGSVGYGFKAPDFRQLYFDFTNSAVGYTVLGYNVAVEKIQELDAQGQLSDILFTPSALEEPLKPESSVGYNFGLAYNRGKLKTELNFFRNDFENLIDTRIIARKTNGQNVFSYTNFSKIYTTGLEVNTQYKIDERLTFSGGYQLLFAKDKEQKEALEEGTVFARDPQTLQTIALDNSDYFGLVNRSRHTANFKIFYDVPNWKANINLRINYRSKYGLFDSNGNGILDDFDTSFVDGYALTNIALNKTFYNNYTVQLGANNLFDYTDNENIPSLAGIQAFVKLNIQF